MLTEWNVTIQWASRFPEQNSVPRAALMLDAPGQRLAASVSAPGNRVAVIIEVDQPEPRAGLGRAEATRASFSRRKATQPGTWASLSPCSKSGPWNP